jgi:hypothetical protein
MAQPTGQNPSHVGLPNGVNYQYLSDLSMLVPRSFPKFIKQFPDLASKNYIVLREAQGSGVYTPNKTFYYWTQKGKNAPSFKVQTNVAAGASSATITCATAYYIDNNTLSPLANGHYYRNDTSGQLYQLTNVNVTTPGAHTATVTTTDGSNVAISTTDLLVWYPTVVGEKSGSQSTIAQVDVKNTNYCATIKTTQEFTDWALFERLDIPNNPEGFDRIKFRQSYNEKDRFLMQQETLLMFGTPFTNIAGVPNQHTGLVPLVQANGQTDTTSTVVNQAYFDNIRRNIDAQGYSMNFDALLNIELRMKWENFIASSFNAGSLVYKNEEAFKGEGAEINRNFKAYDFHGIQLNFKTYDYFSTANIYGETPNTGLWNNAALLIPRGDGVNPEDGTNVPRFNVRWQGESETSTPVKLRLTGGLAPVPTDDVEHLVVSTVATKGVQVFGINGYQFLQLAS